MDYIAVLSPKEEVESVWSISPSPPPPPPPPPEIDNYWKRDNTPVNAVSFGFVATAVLISVFLVMAIFERFLRRRPSLTTFSPLGDRESDAGEASTTLAPAKRDDVTGNGYAGGVSVLMPGQEIPTFIANPVPIPCSPEGISWPNHGQGFLGSCSLDTRLQFSPSVKGQTQPGLV